jgi:hypothetical protein
MPEETPNMVHALKPSTSTVASAGLGVPLGILVVYGLETFAHLVMPDHVQIAIGSVVTILAGYFFSGGRSNDTV